MVFPKLNSVLYPPLGIRTNTESKAVIGFFLDASCIVPAVNAVQ